MIRLPATFTATHQTGGLPGYPAIDVFGRPGELVETGFTGRVHRLSGRPCAQGGVPGGAYGQSIYVVEPNGNDRFLTHFNQVRVKVGDVVKVGTVLGTICDSAVSGKPRTSHIHMGLKRAPAPVPPKPEPRPKPEPEPLRVDVDVEPGPVKLRGQRLDNPQVQRRIRRQLEQGAVVTLRRSERG